MKIEYIPIDFTNMNDCAILAKWSSDPEINYLITPNFHQKSLTSFSPEYVSRLNLFAKYNKYAFFIVLDNYVIGDINIIDNPDFLYKQDNNSCWLGITIGEKNYRGLGIGKEAMKYIEQYARSLGYKRLELGVFEFNKKAIEFYKKLGYYQIAVVPQFTFYNGKWYDDLRFEKYL